MAWANTKRSVRKMAERWDGDGAEVRLENQIEGLGRPQTTSPEVFAHVVTFNNQDTIVSCLNSLLDQVGFQPGKDLIVHVTDNSSGEETAETIAASFPDRVSLTRNLINTGFTGAHNSGIERALSLNARYILLLNPDARLEQDALRQLVDALAEDPRAAMCCPKLLRADQELAPLTNEILDSTGMVITPTIRHFDRGSGEQDRGQYEREEYVFGVSGAALLMRKDFVLDASFPNNDRHTPLRLFDNSFFAYREDADLSWRAQLLGWKCRYVPKARGYHQRVVIPERRPLLSKEINAYGVRNRFLLQLNNISVWSIACCLPGFVYRNAAVLGAACTIEQSSFPSLKGVLQLAPQALRHRRRLLEQARVHPHSVNKWFCFAPYSEPALVKWAPERSISSLLIVIVNYNSGERLADCLLNLAPEIYEIVNKLDISIRVVDNASVDDSALRAKTMFQNSSKVEFILSRSNLGFAGGINQAVDGHPAEAVLILNPDIDINAKSILRLIQTLDTYADIGAVAPVLRNEDGTVQHGFTARSFPTLASTIAELFYLHRLFPSNPWTKEYTLNNDSLVTRYLDRITPAANEPYEHPQKPLLVPQPAGACLLVRRTAFDSSQGFDQSFWPAWFEDVDFCKRLADLGIFSAVVAEATAVHEGGYSLGTLAPGRFYEIWYPNLLAYWKKHGTAVEYTTIRLLLPIALLLRAGITALRTAFHKPETLDGKGNRWKAASTLLRLAINPVGKPRSLP
jgi:GT2 family glycosyltransferase